MVSVQNTVQYINNKACVTSTYFFLSTDQKPTEGVGNGSAGIEMDTSKVYFFDVDNTTWLEWGAESNAASDAASSLSMTRPPLTLGNTFSPSAIEPEEEQEAAEEEMPESITEDGEDE